jgi:1,4-alpha-glucan branching enzyme
MNETIPRASLMENLYVCIVRTTVSHAMECIMPKKSYTRTGRSCRVTFYLPPAVGAASVALCGEFNEWNPAAHPMGKKKDGTFYTSMYLDAGRSYRYRFLLDGQHWENDWEAEAYVTNEHGTEDSVISV